jgi:hypothetical protein
MPIPDEQQPAEQPHEAVPLQPAERDGDGGVAAERGRRAQRDEHPGRGQHSGTPMHERNKTEAAGVEQGLSRQRRGQDPDVQRDAADRDGRGPLVLGEVARRDLRDRVEHERLAHGDDQLPRQHPPE